MHRHLRNSDLHFSSKLSSINPTELKRWAYHWGRQFDQLVALDQCLLPSGADESQLEFLIGFGGEAQVMTQFDELRNWHEHHGSWSLGILGYDVKNTQEKLFSRNQAIIELPELAFLNPKYLMLVEPNGDVWVSDDRLEKEFRTTHLEEQNAIHEDISWNWDTNKATYLNRVKQIQNDIENGNYYELNLCLSATVQGRLNPLNLYQNLILQSPTPFAGYARFGSKSLVCASPERFLTKRSGVLLSQPIKGTAARSPIPSDDLALKEGLFQSEKDRAENVMIVDLVRNDLAKCCRPGTVHVDELFGIYSFSNVHQMISTISGSLTDEHDWIHALESTFPMGSMTGAPKIQTMIDIERYEKFKRQWYSGSLGYITPWNDFDFNVIIRSLMYDEDANKGYAGIGGAITYDSDPESEWNEIQVKAKALRMALEIRD